MTEIDLGDHQPLTWRRSRRRRLIVGLRVIGALFYLVVGAAKLSGAPTALTMFEDIGAGGWLRLAVGGIEVCCGLLLLWRRTVVPAAWSLAVVMAGAVVTQIVVFEGGWELPLALVVLLVGLGFGHRDDRVGGRS